MSRRTLLHLGCGPCVKRTDWIDCDGSWNVIASRFPRWIQQCGQGLMGRNGAQRFEFPRHVRYVSLTRRLPFSDCSADAIYASHVWEHIHRDEVQTLTAECARVLRDGGVLRLAVPNLRAYCEDYLRARSPEAADKLMEDLLLRPRRSASSLVGRLYQSFGDFHSHKWMWDAASLSHLLAQCGFKDAGAKGCCDSRIPEIKQVESEGRAAPPYGVCVEGTKHSV